MAMIGQNLEQVALAEPVLNATPPFRGQDLAVRFEDLKLTRDENNNTKVVLNVSKETLASAPDYKTLDEQPVVEGSAKSDETTKTY